MSASTTAKHVLHWAAAPGGPPPSGDLRDVDALSRPDAELRGALGDLIALTAARLHLGSPPLSDAGSAGCVSLLLAAAIGGAGDATFAPVAEMLLREVIPAEPPARHPAEWVARHGLAGPALAVLPADFACACQAVSPLTAVLRSPDQGQEPEARQVARQMLGHPLGRRALALHFAEPTMDDDIRDWRGDLLERWRLGSESEQAFVLSVYESTMLHHRAVALAQVREADQALADPFLLRHQGVQVFTDEAVISDRKMSFSEMHFESAPVERVILHGLSSDGTQDYSSVDVAPQRTAGGGDDQTLLSALSVARWWGAMHGLERAIPKRLREHVYLGYDYREGVKLFRFAQRLRGGTV
jgi:hypothetical protein